MTAARTKAPAMTEADLLAAVLDLCKLYGLRTAHFRPARTEHGWRTAVSGDGKGFPDLSIVGTRLIVRELKDANGRLTREQTLWLDAFRRAGVDAGVWTPALWRNGTIRNELEALRRRDTA